MRYYILEEYFDSIQWTNILNMKCRGSECHDPKLAPQDVMITLSL